MSEIEDGGMKENNLRIESSPLKVAEQTDQLECP